MSQPREVPLPDPPAGILYLRSPEEVVARRDMDSFQHLLLQAWDTFKLSGVLVIRGIPTVYVREDEEELSPQEVSAFHSKFWNQGVATLLVLVDRIKTRVFSSMVAPGKLTPSQANGNEPLGAFVEELSLAGQALRAHRSEAVQVYHTLCRQIASGHYYRRLDLAPKFNPRETVDAYLLDNLSAIRDKLTLGQRKLDIQIAHAFLGRLLFTCYLIDRGIIELQNYFPGKPWLKLQDVLAADTAEEVFDRLYGSLFSKLKREFNGSMFDDDLAAERNAVRPQHLKAVTDFFAGGEIGKNQRTLGFWAYDFQLIPVETISAIYENFLQKEDEHEKRESGAYYTPRFLAEMTLDLALEGIHSIANERVLDPSCGSGIFLVLLFNRLAARWSAANPDASFKSSAAAYAARDQALRAILTNLRGVDKNLTACRIACFSIYLAFLDQFKPSDIRTYVQQSDAGKLPSLLRFKEGRSRKPDIPMIWEGDFLTLAEGWESEKAERFDIIVGNPPWSGRGTKQIAQKFMRTVPTLLVESGRACLLLPAKVFFNRTDLFQAAWLQQVSLEKVVQLADYSFILFTNAICPCVIARFSPQKPDTATHVVEYLTPKVRRIDLRQGVIPIGPNDRKEIPLRALVGAAKEKLATVAWKGRFWGTECDLKFLNHLFALPRLGEKVDQLSRTRGKRKRQWVAGQGCKPWSLNPKKKSDRTLRPFVEAGDRWSPKDQFVTPGGIEGQIVIPKGLCPTVAAHFAEKHYSTDSLYSKPPATLFSPPLVLFNQGFTDATFFDFTVRFQHSLQSIAGPQSDEKYLLFLAAYLRSKLARYFVFHTAANLGTERDKVHLDEALHLPFYLPGDKDMVAPNCKELLDRIVGKVRGLQQRIEESAAKLDERLNPKSFRLGYADEGSHDEERQKWRMGWIKPTAKVQAEIEPLLYEYFGIIAQEQALVEETCDVFDKSDTPGTVDAAMPTLESLESDELEPYASMIAETLHTWSKSRKLKLSMSAGIDNELGIAVLRIAQTKGNGSFGVTSLAPGLAEALKRLEDAATTANGSIKYIRDETWFFEGPTVYIAKPALRGRWTRTAALNDAAEIYTAIQFCNCEKT